MGGAAQSELHALWLGQNKTSLLTFTPCDLLKLIRGRTVWLSGDSQQQARWPTSCCGVLQMFFGEDFYTALACLPEIWTHACQQSIGCDLTIKSCCA